MLYGIGRHEGEAQPGCYHRQSPIVAFAPIGRRAGDALLLKNLIGVPREFPVHAVNVIFAIHFSHRKFPLVGESVAAMHSEHHLLAKEWDAMDTLVTLRARQCVDDGLEVTG